MADQVIGGINKAIQENARASADWKYQSKADKAYSIYEVVNEQLFQGQLPSVVIGFDDRLKKWSCACPVNVRVATNLTAYCTTCDADFEEQF